MSRQDANAAFALSSFLQGTNAAYIDDLYARYEQDPGSVDAEWQEFFKSLKDTPDDVRKNAEGASWGRDNWPLAPKDELTSALDGNWAQVEKAVGTKLAAKAQAKGRRELSAADVHQATRDSVRALMLIRAYRMRGHFHAKLDPLGIEPPRDREELDPRSYGFVDGDFDRKIFLDHVLGLEYAHLARDRRDLRAHLLPDARRRVHAHHQRRAEELDPGTHRRPGQGNQFHPRGPARDPQQADRSRRFREILRSQIHRHQALRSRWRESLIPALEQIIKRGGNLGVKEIVVGMPHRGRLNVLTQVMGKPHRALFHEFKGGSANPDAVEGSGDVKYHLGASSDREFDNNRIHLSLTANPSHLEIVDPVVLGKVRAKQDQHGDPPDQRISVLPLLMHGDAAFAGQGVVAECFGLSDLKGYRTGGSLHFIVNNQIGFTTYPRYSRSSPYPSDVAKMIDAPIFHVNGDDPEAVVFAAKVAIEFRQKFHKPVVIDMFCYRRHGHNEGDEPMFTQPVMYKKIAAHPGTVEIYSKRLIADGVMTEGEVEKAKADWRARLDAELEAGSGYKPNKADWLDGKWAGFKSADAEEDPRRGVTGVDLAVLKDIGRKITKVPDGFRVHRTVQRFLENRAKAIDTGVGIDWATGEALAFCTLLQEGHHVRLSGQDSERGTFSQRHSVLIDQEDESRYTPFNHLGGDQGHYEVINSLLSEEAVLGFEYGYSLAEPNALAIWEAQFGDFANGAQVLFDQFISSGERKWLRMSGLVCMLPHGYEGQGPEHSSARLERYSADVRRRQHAGGLCHHAGQFLPRAAPAIAPRNPQAADPDDAEVAAAAQAGGVAARRDGREHHVPPHPLR